MTILTAKIAGVPHVTACTPPILGQIPPATVAAMHLAGADEIYILGGVQAVAGMAVGTETMQKVDFIAGPGNAFVAEAKRQLFGEIGIDLFAGPTEILVVADEHADPYTVATDLLSQAEHGPDTPAVLVTNSEEVARKSIEAVDALLEVLPTAPIAGVSWKDFGEVIVTESLDEAFKVADEFASEHVEILTREPRQALEKMKHYGALFLGEGTCVSYGDKVSSIERMSMIKLLTSDSVSAQTMSCLQGRQPSTLVVFGSASTFAHAPTRKSGTHSRVESWAGCAAAPPEPRTLRVTPEVVT